MNRSFVLSTTFLVIAVMACSVVWAADETVDLTTMSPASPAGVYGNIVVGPYSANDRLLVGTIAETAGVTPKVVIQGSGTTNATLALELWIAGSTAMDTQWRVYDNGDIDFWTTNMTLGPFGITSYDNFVFRAYDVNSDIPNIINGAFTDQRAAGGANPSPVTIGTGCTAASPCTIVSVAPAARSVSHHVIVSGVFEFSNASPPSGEYPYVELYEANAGSLGKVHVPEGANSNTTQGVDIPFFMEVYVQADATQTIVLRGVNPTGIGTMNVKWVTMRAQAE